MILFAGDSFSANDGENSWTEVYTKNFNSSFNNTSIGGSSIWIAYKNINKEKTNILQNKYKTIVITCTHPYRIPYCTNPKMCARRGEYFPITNKNEVTDDIIHFHYFDRFFDKELHDFLYIKSLKDIVNSYKNNTNIILLPCFSESLELIKILYSEIPNFSYLDFPLLNVGNIDMNNPEYKNHFTIKTNLAFGNLLADRTKDYKQEKINLLIKEIADKINDI